MKELKRIWLADDHQLVIDGFKLLLSLRDDLWVEGYSLDGAGLLKDLAQHPVDVLVSDLKMPGMDGLELMMELKKRYPHLPVLVVSMSDEIEIIDRLFNAEVEGYILKNAGKDELFKAIDNLLNGRIYYQKELLDAILASRQKHGKTSDGSAHTLLSKRELEVLDLIVREFTSKQIAEQLHISKQTVDSHRLNIYEKTGTKTLVGLIKFAIARGFR